MKYMVQVNRNMMISIEAETALRAEHKMFDFDGVAMAMAFDHDMMKTDTFRGALMSCDTVSLAELAELSGNYTKAWQAVGKAQDEKRIAQSEVERIEEELRKAKADLAQAVINYNHCISEAKSAKACMGLRDDD